MEKTVIAWTDRTFNAWMGCTKVSDGCRNCYAETLTRDRMGLSLWGPGGARQRTSVTYWRQPAKWDREAQALGRPLRVFIGSLMDWAEDRPELDPWRQDLWEVIRSTPHLHYQMLTKRPERIIQLLPGDWGSDGWENVWLGTSIENMRVAERADHLRAIPAVVRFVSYEPALGPLDDLDLAGIDWVIYGGESGPRFRAEDKDWARRMRDRCSQTGVAFFHKQSAARRTETGIELDGEIVRHYPAPRSITA